MASTAETDEVIDRCWLLIEQQILGEEAGGGERPQRLDRVGRDLAGEES